MRANDRALLALAAVALAGCPRFSNDGLVCGAGASCPPGFHCAADQRCWKLGQNPDLSAAAGGSHDLGGVASGADLAGVPPGADLAGPAAGSSDMAGALAIGQLCSAPSDCLSQHCVDGVCCDLACSGPCTSCNQPTSLGKCTPVVAGNTPSHGTCGPDTMTSCGRNGKCDGAGACQKWDSTTVCGTSSCAAGSFIGVPHCDGNGLCKPPNPTPCDPYKCKDASACATMCTPGSTTECTVGTCSVSGSCGPRSLGQPCMVASEATDCKSGHCVDGVCCDMPLATCSGCKACNLGTPGTCANVTSGDPHNACPTNASNCQAGGCSGGSCVPSTVGTICGSTCTSTNMFAVSKCSGAATGCPAAGPATACAGNLTCQDGASCHPSCSVDGDCISGYWCNGGNCAAQGDPGAGCTLATNCTASSCDQCKSNAACTLFYRDADGDGYGNPNVSARFCGSSAPTGYSADNSDCCDILNDATAQATHPGQAGWFTSPNGCGSFNYDCSVDGGGQPVIETQYGTGAGSCTTGGACTCMNPFTCTIATAGWVGTVPGCGGTGTWLGSSADCGRAGGQCPCTCADTSNHCGISCNSANNGGSPRQQGCH